MSAQNKPDSFGAGSSASQEAAKGVSFFAVNKKEMVEANLGWLVKAGNIDGSAGLLVEYDYNPLTDNSGLADLDPARLAVADTAFQVNRGITGQLTSRTSSFRALVAGFFITTALEERFYGW